MKYKTYQEKMLKENKVKEHKLISFFNGIFILILICILSLTYMKLDPSAKVIKKIFNKDINFDQVNNLIDEYVNNIFKESSIEEEFNLYYEDLNYNRYRTENKEIKALKSGEIKDISTNENDYFIMIDYGKIDAIYYLIDVIDKEKGFSFEGGEKITSYQGEYFYCIFLENNEVINYQDIK